jgi:hypothetical protein
LVERSGPKRVRVDKPLEPGVPVEHDGCFDLSVWVATLVIKVVMSARLIFVPNKMYGERARPEKGSLPNSTGEFADIGPVA